MADERREGIEERRGRDRTTLTLKAHSPLLEFGELIVVTKNGTYKYEVKCTNGVITFKVVK